MRWLIAASLALACSHSAATAPTEQPGQAARTGVVSGRVRDAASGTALAGIVIAADNASSTTTASDGSYRLVAPIGRLTLGVSASGYVPWKRTVLIGSDPAVVAITLVGTDAPQAVGSAGGALATGAATITVPSGAFAGTTSISATFVPPAALGHLASPLRWRDDSGTFHSIKGVLHIESAAEPSKPVQLKMPVPANATAATVTLFTLDANGQWSSPIRPDVVAGGFANFTVSHFSDDGVSCDAALQDLISDDESPTFADGDPADDSGTVGPPPPNVSTLIGASTSGSVVTVTLGNNAPWNTTYTTGANQAARIIFPDGSEMNVGPGTQFTLQPPGIGTWSTGLAGLLYGRLRALVTKTVGGGGTFVTHPDGAAGVRGTAFTASSNFCGYTAGPAHNEPSWTDVIEVQEGSVLEDEFPGSTSKYNKSVILEAGQNLLINAYSPPPCGPWDGGVPDAGSGGTQCCCVSASPGGPATNTCIPACASGQSCVCNQGTPSCG